MHKQVYTIAKVCSEFGCTHAIICPGSRSAPLLYAFKQEKNITCISVIDERSAGFIALGIAQQTSKPVVLICTSGTALLNFFPAIAEAKYQQLPLIVLSADRPPEMLNQQDGQMIMQKGVYGKHVNNSHELMCEEANNSDLLLTQRIVQTALVETMEPGNIGPVHVNVPLREPLYPQVLAIETPPLEVFDDISNTTLPFSLKDLDLFAQAYKQANKVVIVLGQQAPSEALENILSQFSKLDKVVLLADVVSNQHQQSVVPNFDAVVQYASIELLQSIEPDMVISSGGPMVSKALKLWLKSINPQWHFRISEESKPVNTYGNLTHFIRSSLPVLLAKFLESKLSNEPNVAAYSQKWMQLGLKANALQQAVFAQQGWSEPLAVSSVLKVIPTGSVLHIGNSGSIRFASWLGLNGFAGKVFGNRGTSGIEGSVSTAIGAAIANPSVTHFLICGDLSFLYDTNAWWLNTLPQNLKIVVLNNVGGKIFEWIEGPSRHPEHLHFFTTPYHRSIAQTLATFGIQCTTCQSTEAFNQALTSFIQSNQTHVLELLFDAEMNLSIIQQFKSIQLTNL